MLCTLCMLCSAGTLPEEWAEPGALPRLTLLAVQSNRLTGTLPADWELPSLLIMSAGAGGEKGGVDGGW